MFKSALSFSLSHFLEGLCAPILERGGLDADDDGVGVVEDDLGDDGLRRLVAAVPRVAAPAEAPHLLAAEGGVQNAFTYLLTFLVNSRSFSNLDFVLASTDKAEQISSLNTIFPVVQCGAVSGGRNEIT